MSTLRKDPVSGGWVILPEEASAAVLNGLSQSVNGEEGLVSEECPYCEGHESRTPPEILAHRTEGSKPNQRGWNLRVVPNQSAVLHIEGPLGRRGNGIYDQMNGVGAHEAVIETPAHDARMGEYSQEKMESIVRIYRERVIDLHRDDRFIYVQIFRNYGTQSGAIQEHPHSQIIALPIVPRWVKEEMTNAREYFDYKERCLFCDIVSQETKDQDRIVFENEFFMVFEPFAPKFPFETWILPKLHSHDFRLLNDEQIAPFAQTMRTALNAMMQALNDPPYNFMIHSAPRIMSQRSGASRTAMEYHWHLEIIPRITEIAGFEWATGFYINQVWPEEAARRLRAHLPK